MEQYAILLACIDDTTDIGTVMYALDQCGKSQVEVIDLSDFYEGINPEEVLSMTYRGDLTEHFGEEGSEQEELETRQIKETTASKYLMKDEKGGWLLNPDVPFDSEHDHGVYSANNGLFPFALRPYKYMLLRNKRDITADVILLELAPKDEWEVFEEPTFNDDGDLIDRETKEVLVRASDVLRSKDMTERDFHDETITQWTIIYKKKKGVEVQERYQQY